VCGLFGFADSHGNISASLSLLKKGIYNINHRGPDGIYTWHNEKVFLGHARLAIIDLSDDANQPFKSTSDEVWIIFNGEIYNYKDLRTEIGEHKFRTKSDTETLLEGYIKFGFNFFNKIRGIYAFAILDLRAEQKIIVGRDPSGTKPLFLFNKNGNLAFASEIKAMLPLLKGQLSINENIVKAYINLGFCPEPYTIYNEIYTLEPGTIEIHSNTKVEKIKFFEFDFQKRNNKTFAENLNNIEDLLKKAVERNLVADVDIAVALSGGIDSSLIYALTYKSGFKPRGISVYFKDHESSEQEIVKKYVETLQGEVQYIEGDNLLNIDLVNKILLHFDQPYGDSSAFNLYFLTQASSKFTRVLIGGDGGDEIFNGYPSQTWLRTLNYLKNFPIINSLIGLSLNIGKKLLKGNKKRTISRLVSLWFGKENIIYDWISWFPANSTLDGISPFLFDTNIGREIYMNIFVDEEPIDFNHQITFDRFRKIMLSDYLRKTDMMSMMNSVEYRVPMLDEDLVKYALKIPEAQKSNRKQTKIYLRKIHSEFYPSKTSNAPKKGFTIPLDKVLNKADYSQIFMMLTSSECYIARFIKKEYIINLFDALENYEKYISEISKAGVYQRILIIYSLELWYQNNKQYFKNAQ
jgi:asparagine synthase (glutamine-hydrolysing)